MALRLPAAQGTPDRGADGELERDELVSVVILAKDASQAKTRLQLPRKDVVWLARHLAAITVRAATAAETVGAVFVVTGDVAIADGACEVGAIVVPEPCPLGINRAAALGRRYALDARPESPVAMMVSDLPCLRGSDIDFVVDEFLGVGTPLFVEDHECTGTTFLIHGPDQCPGIGFGRSSALMHRRLGYTAAAATRRSLRYDVDTVEDLAAVPTLGPLMVVEPPREIAEPG